MKKVKLVVPLLFLVLIVTGCNNSVSEEKSNFIRACNNKSGCKYKVLSEECVCDKTHTYIPYTS